mmetsp:Transcript_14470/g.34884  ORF Transcript_14470/g.34884 Transcript_14470/m.34884 type:complete len:233 (-) Transcript_14470:193-891(-)
MTTGAKFSDSESATVDLSTIVPRGRARDSAVPSPDAVPVASTTKSADSTGIGHAASSPLSMSAVCTPRSSTSASFSACRPSNVTSSEDSRRAIAISNPNFPSPMTTTLSHFRMLHWCGISNAAASGSTKTASSFVTLSGTAKRLHSGTWMRSANAPWWPIMPTTLRPAAWCTTSASNGTRCRSGGGMLMSTQTRLPIHCSLMPFSSSSSLSPSPTSSTMPTNSCPRMPSKPM